jgi:hypothetical protein
MSRQYEFHERDAYGNMPNGCRRKYAYPGSVWKFRKPGELDDLRQFDIAHVDRMRWKQNRLRKIPG